MIVYLLPRAPFAKAAPRSDTLFGAICWAIRWLYDEETLVKLLAGFADGQAPFILSSLFPYVENTTTNPAPKILFVPRPLLAPNFGGLVKGQSAYQIYKIST